MQSSRLFQPAPNDNRHQRYDHLLAKQKILICQINDYARMAECKRLADSQGKIAEFRENRFVKKTTELTEPVEYYEQKKTVCEIALAELQKEIVAFQHATDESTASIRHNESL